MNGGVVGAETSDHPIQKHTQVRLRVHHIVQVSRFAAGTLF